MSIGSAAAPRFHPLAAMIFESFLSPLRKFRLGGLHILNAPAALPGDRPVILVGNHVSNWDGFLFREIQKSLFRKWPVYSIMLEEELARYPMIRLLGGIGIDPASPASVAGALRSLRAMRARKQRFFLSYFPQGRIFPSFKRPLGFRPGIDLFVKAVAPATLIPVGIHLEPMKKLAPTAFLSMGKPMSLQRAAPVHRILEDLVQAEIDRIHDMLSRHGEDAPAQLAARASAAAA